MISARLRLTLIYLVTAVGVTISIGIATNMGRTSNNYQRAAREALLNAEMAASIIDGVKPRGGTLLVEDEITGERTLHPYVSHLLRTIPGYLVVVGQDTLVHFWSKDVVNMKREDWNILFEGMKGISDSGPAGVVQIHPVGKVVLVAASVRDTTTELARAIAGVVVTSPPWPTQLKVAFFVIAPLLIIGSTLFVWHLLTGSFNRIERIRREVAAIADGRSLHSRLSVDEASPELLKLIDTLNAMIARLEKSFMALRRFTADASHELKTPLAVLRADVERAMYEKTSTPERMIALEEALHEVTRMSDLVDSLLTLARADEGRFELHREPVDLRELTQEVYETALILGEGAGVSVNLPFTTDVTIMGDRARLRQLFLNLVTNAIKYTPKGGRVDIGLGKHPSTVTFAVRDTGIGISAADLPHIFERFWRADRVRSRSSERGGVGLGLAISQWIAQAHGGALTVSSRLGKGSLFTVTLPLDS
jgi:two-component system OmpR family sensor kinase